MIDLGDALPDFAVEIRDAANALATPGGLVLTLTLPDGTVLTSPTTIAYANPSTGKYTATYVTVQSGRHVARWVATGANASAHEILWNVSPPDPGFIVSLAAVRAHLNFNDPLKTASDEEIRGWLPAVTKVIENRVGPVVVTTVVDEDHDGGPSLWLRQTPVLVPFTGTVVPFLTSGTTYLAADLRVTPGGRLRRKDGLPFTGGPFAVTYKAGRQVVGENITQAAAVILKGFWETQRGPSGSPSQSVDELLNLPGMGLVMQHAELLLAGELQSFGFA
jgi:hypothetical protein